MKLSFTTLGCPDWDFQRILQEAETMGFDGIEIRGIDGVMRAEEIPQLFPENLDTTKRCLAKHHLEMIGFGTSANFHTEENARRGLEEGTKAIEVCAAAGIPAIRVFGDQLPDPDHTAETVDLVGRSIAELSNLGEKQGVMVLLEIHGEFNTIETVSGVIQHCKSCHNFGILWDVEHSDRSYGDDWMPFYQLIRPYLKHIHIKDHIRNADGTFTLCLPGQGDIPISKIVSKIERDGYEGYYSLEWEKKWHPELPEPGLALRTYLDLMKSLEQECR